MESCGEPIGFTALAKAATHSEAALVLTAAVAFPAAQTTGDDSPLPAPM